MISETVHSVGVRPEDNVLRHDSLAYEQLMFVGSPVIRLVTNPTVLLASPLVVVLFKTLTDGTLPQCLSCGELQAYLADEQVESGVTALEVPCIHYRPTPLGNTWNGAFVRIHIPPICFRPRKLPMQSSLKVAETARPTLDSVIFTVLVPVVPMPIPNTGALLRLPGCILTIRPGDRVVSDNSLPCVRASPLRFRPLPLSSLTLKFDVAFSLVIVGKPNGKMMVPPTSSSVTTVCRTTVAIEPLLLICLDYGPRSTNVRLPPRFRLSKLKLLMANIDRIPPPLPARQQLAIRRSIPAAPITAVLEGNRVAATNIFRLLLGKKEAGACRNSIVTLV